MGQVPEIANIGIRISRDQFDLLQNHLFKDSCEQIAYAFSSRAEFEEGIILIIKEIILPSYDDINENSNDHVSHKFDFYNPLRMRAIDEGLTFLSIHSHQNKNPQYSELDDICDLNLLKLLQSTDAHHHGSIVFDQNQDFSARYLNVDLKSFTYIDYMLIYGNKIEKKFSFSHKKYQEGINEELFRRQIQFLTNKRQFVFRNLNVAIIGVGGTGSSIAYQLRRLGIGNLFLIDDDDIESSNISRLYSTLSSDVGSKKTSTIATRLQEIYDFGQVKSIPKNAFSLVVVNALKMMDFIFVASDENDLGRYIAQLIVKYYGIPAIDVGIEVQIDKREGILAEVNFRSHYLLPDRTCLFKVGTINMTDIYNDLLYLSDKGTYRRQAKEGYLKDKTLLENPAVISFNTFAASRAVSVFVRLFASRYHYSQEKRKLYNTESLPEIVPLEKCDCEFCKVSPSLQGDQDYPLGIFSWGQE